MPTRDAMSYVASLHCHATQPYYSKSLFTRAFNSTDPVARPTLALDFMRFSLYVSHAITCDQGPRVHLKQLGRNGAVSERPLLVWAPGLARRHTLF